MQEKGTETDEGGLLASCVINDMQAAPEARIHAAEHGHAAGLLWVQVAQRRCVLHQPSAEP